MRSSCPAKRRPPLPRRTSLGPSLGVRGAQRPAPPDPPRLTTAHTRCMLSGVRSGKSVWLKAPLALQQRSGLCGRLWGLHAYHKFQKRSDEAIRLHRTSTANTPVQPSELTGFITWWCLGTGAVFGQDIFCGASFAHLHDTHWDWRGKQNARQSHSR